MLTALLFAAASAFAAPQWHDNFDAALAEAKSSGKPVLMDFQAPWCYSCYYMEKHVLDGDRFAKAASKLVLLKLDVDKEEGHALKEKFRVSFLPSYLLLSSKGEPVGRIVGEQTQGDFLKQLDSLMGGGSADPLDEDVASLKKRLAASEFDQAAADIRLLKSDRRKALDSRQDWQILSARLELMRAIKAKRAYGVESLKKTLALDDSCQSVYDADYASELVDKQKPEARRQILELERASLEKLIDARLFVPVERRCADFRSGIEVLADVYEKLERKDKREELLKRTVAFMDQQGLRPGEDRNFDDNKRLFLELLGDEPALRELYPALIEAYPSDYVYAQRWAKWLQAHGKSSEALSFSDKADKLAYGANRLAVTLVRAKILADLGRKPEALALLKRDSKAGRAAFPKEAQSLDELAAQLSKS